MNITSECDCNVILLSHLKQIHAATVVDWSAESAPLKANDSFLADRLTYRISGIEEAATKLSLELNANLPGEPENSETIFLSAAKVLIMRALGDEPAERFAVQYSQTQ